jgi:hypothetical protein
VKTGKSYYQFQGSTALGDKSNIDLQGRKWYPIADKMLNDPIISGLAWMLSSTLMGGTWEIKGGRDDYREFIDSVFDNEFLEKNKSASRYLYYGSYAFEQQLFVRTDGKIVDNLLPRQPHTFISYDRNQRGEIESIRQSTVNGAGILPRWRTIIFARDHESWQNPNGRSLLLPCYQPWLLKVEHRLQDLYGAQRFANGTLHFQMADSATDDDILVAEAIGQSYAGGANSYLITKPNANIAAIEIINATGSPYDAEPKVLSYNQEMARAFLGQFLMMDTGSLGGAQELVRELIERFYVAMQEIADEMAETWTYQRIHRLLKWNFPDVQMEDAPYMVVSGINKKSPEEVTALLGAIAGILPGGFMNVEDWNAIKESMGLTPYSVQSNELSSGCNHANGCSHVKLSANGWARELTAAEKRVDFTGLEMAEDLEVERLKSRMDQINSDMIRVYERYAVQAIVDGDIEKLDAIEPRYVDELEELFDDSLARMRDVGKRSVYNEFGKKELQQVTPEQARSAQRILARRKARATASAIAEAVATEGLELIGAGIELNPVAVTEALRQAATRRANAMVAAVAYAIPALGVGSGRQEAVQELKDSGNAPTRTFYSAILDRNTCTECAKVDGQEVTNGQPAAPNPDCEGGSNCRCVHVYEWDL